MFSVTAGSAIKRTRVASWILLAMTASAGPWRTRAGSIGAFGWSGAASSYYTIDPKQHLIAILLMQHLPREQTISGMPALPKISAKFYDLMYQSLR